MSWEGFKEFLAEMLAQIATIDTLTSLNNELEQQGIPKVEQIRVEQIADKITKIIRLLGQRSSPIGQLELIINSIKNYQIPEKASESTKSKIEKIKEKIINFCNNAANNWQNKNISELKMNLKRLKELVPMK